MDTFFLLRKHVRYRERFIMEATNEPVDIFLGIPILVSMAGKSQISVIPQLPQIGAADIQELHQALVIIDALSPRGDMDALPILPFDNTEDPLEQLLFTRFIIVEMFFCHNNEIDCDQATMMHSLTALPLFVFAGQQCTLPAGSGAKISSISAIPC